MLNKLLLFTILFLPFLYITTYTPTHEFAMYFIDVGQGDATLIQTTQDNYCIIDTGKSKNIVEPLSQIKPFLKELDCVILTHADADHIEAILAILKRYEVRNLFINYTTKSNGLIEEIKDTLQAHNTSVFSLSKDSDFYLDDVFFDVLWPEDSFSELKMNLDSNDASISIKIEYEGFSFFTAGDLGFEYENNLDIGNVTGAKASHHGSKTSTSYTFIQKLKPEFMIISAGKANSYGHPHQEVLENIQSLADTDIYRTDLNGTIKAKYHMNRLEISCNECNTKTYTLD